jgi:ArsR family transcriptional regulator
MVLTYMVVVMHSSSETDRAAELLSVLASPIRLRLLVLLTEEPRRVTDLVEALGASQPLVSRHLRVLRDAGLARGERRGREVIYEVADAHVGHIVADALEHAREIDAIGATHG